MTLEQWLQGIELFIIAAGYGDLFDQIISHETWHLLLGLLAGSLAWLVTLTILYVPYTLISRLTRRPMRLGVAFGILILCLLLSVSFALISHWLLDYMAQLWVTPLGPPLDLIQPYP